MPCQPKGTCPLAECGALYKQLGPVFILSSSPGSATSLTFSESVRLGVEWVFFSLPSVPMGSDWLVEIQPAPALRSWDSGPSTFVVS